MGAWGASVRSTVLQDGGLLIGSGGMGYLFQLEATEEKISSGEEHQDDEQPSAIPKHTKTRPARINFMSIKASSHACMPVRMWKGWLWHDTSTVQT